LNAVFGSGLKRRCKHLRLVTVRPGVESGQPAQTLDRELAEADVPDQQRVTLAFGITYETAVLEWFRALPSVLAGTPRRG